VAADTVEYRTGAVRPPLLRLSETRQLPRTPLLRRSVNSQTSHTNRRLYPNWSRLTGALFWRAPKTDRGAGTYKNVLLRREGGGRLPRRGEPEKGKEEPV
jgi:hypothetical protein